LRLFLWLWLAIGSSLVADCARAQIADWPALGFKPVVTNVFAAPTCISHAEDGSQRLFVAQRGGQIRIIQNSNVVSQPFLDITDHVLSAGFEQGLLGLAFPPGYATNSHFYVDYTRQSDGAVVVSRFSLTTEAN